MSQSARHGRFFPRLHMVAPGVRPMQQPDLRALQRNMLQAFLRGFKGHAQCTHSSHSGLFKLFITQLTNLEGSARHARLRLLASYIVSNYQAFAKHRPVWPSTVCTAIRRFCGFFQNVPPILISPPFIHSPKGSQPLRQTSPDWLHDDDLLLYQFKTKNQIFAQRST
jgi:hypothetical protein